MPPLVSVGGRFWIAFVRILHNFLPVWGTKGFLCLLVCFRLTQDVFSFLPKHCPKQSPFQTCPRAQPSLCNFIPEQKREPVCLDRIPSKSVLFFKYLHIKQNQEQKKDIFSLLIPIKIEEGRMKFVCVEEQKLRER